MEDLATFQDIYGNTSQGTRGVDSLFPSFADFGDIGNVLLTGPKIATGAVTSVYESVTKTVKGVYFYLIGGIVLVGIIAIVVLGLGSKLLAQVQGAKF